MSMRRTAGSFVLLVIMFFGALSTPHTSYAFHDGGIGNCDGCHGRRVVGQQLGNSAENQVPSAVPASFTMLKGSDPSSTCLLCHEAPAGNNAPSSHYVATRSSDLAQGVPPNQLTPGGDFGWLKKEYRWTASDRTGSGKQELSPGERHGHSIVAQDYGYAPDARQVKAPGGDYPVMAMGCTSCHDPHGDYKRYATGIVNERGIAAGGSGSYRSSRVATATIPVGVFRLLGGKGYRPRTAMGAREFSADPPAAVAPDAYNRSEKATDTRVAYGSGMSEWCQNCHTMMHGRNTSGSFGHPTGKGARISGDVVVNYNSYVASGNLNGNIAKAYTSMVPFEMGTDDYSTLMSAANSDGSNLRGIEGGGSGAQVMCLTCHRAHASGWDSIARWNTSTTFLVVNGKYPGTDNFADPENAQGRSAAEVRKTFYDRQPSAYATYQRGLCNKCHAKD